MTAKGLSLSTFSLSLMMYGCTSFSPPPPFLTAGGPETAKPQHSEIALAGGMGEGDFSNGGGWMARWRYGVAQNVDAGVDAMYIGNNGTNTGTLMAAGRWQAAPRVRLEAGAGWAEDSYGTSANAELTCTAGTANDGAPWKFYGTLRAASAWGMRGNVFGGPSNATPSPNTGFLTLKLGAEARITDAQKVFFEAGYGAIVPVHQQFAGVAFIAAGLIFDMGNTENARPLSPRFSLALWERAGVRAHVPSPRTSGFPLAHWERG